MKRGKGNKGGKPAAPVAEAVVPSPAADAASPSDASSPDDKTAEADMSVSPSFPASADEWRALVAAMPARDLLRFVQKDKAHVAKIFAGFRPDVNTVRRALVLNRIVEEAIKAPKFGKELAEAAAEVVVASSLASEEEGALDGEGASPSAGGLLASPSLGAGGASLPSTEKASPAADTDERLRLRVQEQRAALRERDERIRSLSAALAQTERERDAAQAEAKKNETERDAAILRAETEKRRADRETRRRLEKPESAPMAAKRITVPATPEITGTLTPAFNVVIFIEALKRMLARGRHLAVADVCREVLAQTTGDARTRGNVTVLLAQSLYRQGRDDDGAEQDKRAAEYLLSAGRLGDSADALARAIAATAGGGTVKAGKLAADTNEIIGKLLALADRTGATETVRQSFARLRLMSPHGFAQLAQTLQKGDKRRKEFYQSLAPAITGRDLGPDELVALPSPTGETATVTPRRLALMVEGNDVRQVARVRHALTLLRESGADGAALADALLSACARLLPAALFPFAVLSPPRPVVVDASNVARYDPDPLAHLDPKARTAQTGKLRYLLLMRDHLLRKGYFPVWFIADATLRFIIDDRAAYIALADRHAVIETPPNTSADMRLISEARDQGALLVTNDRLGDWGEAAEDVERRGFGIFGDTVSLLQN